MLWPMESVPKFRGDEEVFPCTDALIDGFLDTLSNLLFVAVVASTVKHTVTSLDRVVDNVSAYVLWHLPKTETHLWELVSVGKNQIRDLVCLSRVFDHLSFLVVEIKITLE